MVSSLGFHTIELSLRLISDEALELLEAFKKSKDVYLDENSGQYVYLYRCSSKYYYIRYRQMYKGISWILRYSGQSPEYMRPPMLYEDRCCTIKAKVNPKILLETTDYVTAADSSCLNKLMAVFNHEVAKISPILKDFGSYTLSRIDYCLNFDLADLRIINGRPEDYMMLIQQADIPRHFTEYTEYRGTTHRKKPGVNSFYLENNSVHLNCYYKHYQMQTEFPSAPDIDNSLNVIRFEIQCLYLKTRYMQKQIRDYEDDFEKILLVMLSDEISEKIITSYYNKTIGKGDYYTLVEARKKIRSMNFHQNKENRLIEALELVNTHRGIYKAKAHLSGKKLDDFRRSIKDLGEMGINPVTIPRERGIKHLPNLLAAYSAERERVEKELDKYRHNHYAVRNFVLDSP